MPCTCVHLCLDADLEKFVVNFLTRESWDEIQREIAGRMLSCRHQKPNWKQIRHETPPVLLTVLPTVGIIPDAQESVSSSVSELTLLRPWPSCAVSH